MSDEAFQIIKCLVDYIELNNIGNQLIAILALIVLGIKLWRK